jgi:hypothetical protein
VEERRLGRGEQLVRAARARDSEIVESLERQLRIVLIEGGDVALWVSRR